MILPICLDGFLKEGKYTYNIRFFSSLVTFLNFGVLVAQFKVKRFFRTGNDSFSENQALYPGTRFVEDTTNRKIYGLGKVLNVFQISETLFSTDQPKDRADRQKEEM